MIDKNAIEINCPKLKRKIKRQTKNISRTKNFNQQSTMNEKFLENFFFFRLISLSSLFVNCTHLRYYNNSFRFTIRGQTETERHEVWLSNELRAVKCGSNKLNRITYRRKVHMRSSFDQRHSTLDTVCVALFVTKMNATLYRTV